MLCYWPVNTVNVHISILLSKLQSVLISDLCCFPKSNSKDLEFVSLFLLMEIDMVEISLHPMYSDIKFNISVGSEGTNVYNKSSPT